MDYFIFMKCLEIILFFTIVSGVVFLFYQWTFVYSEIYYKTTKNFKIYVLCVLWGFYTGYAMLYSYLKACFTNPGYLDKQNKPTDVDLSGAPMEELDEENYSNSKPHFISNSIEQQLRVVKDLEKFCSGDNSIVDDSKTS